MKSSTLPVITWSVTDVFSRDQLVFRDLMAHREKKEREDPEVSLVLLDHSDHLERE